MQPVLCLQTGATNAGILNLEIMFVSSVKLEIHRDSYAGLPIFQLWPGNDSAWLSQLSSLATMWKLSKREAHVEQVLALIGEGVEGGQRSHDLLDQHVRALGQLVQSLGRVGVACLHMENHQPGTL